jgi:hypothetical protein
MKFSIFGKRNRAPAELTNAPLVNVVRLKPGDLLVLRYAQPLPVNARAQMQDTLARVFPQNRCVVLGGDVALSIVRPEHKPAP